MATMSTIHMDHAKEICVPAMAFMNMVSIEFFPFDFIYTIAELSLSSLRFYKVTEGKYNQGKIFC